MHRETKDKDAKDGDKAIYKYLKNGLSCDATRWLPQYQEYVATGGRKSAELEQFRVFHEFASAAKAFIKNPDTNGERERMALIADIEGKDFKALANEYGMANRATLEARDRMAGGRHSHFRQYRYWYKKLKQT